MNTNQLREVAEKATPGPWRYDYEPGYCGEIIAASGTCLATFNDEPSASTAAHIATFNPALVMKMLDVVEAAQAIDKYLPIDKVQTLIAIGDLRAAIKALEE